MKTLYSCLFILTFFISCDDDATIATPNVVNSRITGRIATELPGNTANPYDEAGWIHNELFETYYESSTKPTTIAGVISRVEAIADSNSNFKVIKTASYHPVSEERIQYLLDHKGTCVSEVIANSTLSSNAKLSLSNFMVSLDEKFAVETSCDLLYNYVAAYEKTVVDNATFTSKDKQLMLTTTSIARHTVYLARKKPKKNTNPDWTILILHIATAEDGAEFGMAESITEGLVAGIVSNQ